MLSPKFVYVLSPKLVSVFSPKFITQNIYDASVSTITAAIVNKVKRFVYCSSMARYGVQKTPYSEEMPTLPEDPYGIAKVAGEETLKILAKVQNMLFLTPPRKWLLFHLIKSLAPMVKL